MVDHVTVTQAAEHLSAHFGCDIPVWKVRRTVDATLIDIPRAGNYRLIPRTALEQLAESLRSWVAAHRKAELCVAGGCKPPVHADQGGAGNE